jgi:NAD(P)-dependent dehydrogenase (short-subunit alcohol dehydrogenase family)
MSAGHVLVTGASGGIGGAVSDVLHARGWQVTGLDVRPRPPGTIASEDWQAVEVDVADRRALSEAVAVARGAGPITALVHAAAVQPVGPAGSLGLDVWERCLQVNVLALEQLVAECLDDLRRAHGAVVAVSSVHARATTREMAAYATSKAALEGWTRAAALDLAPQVRVNAVAPGAVHTPMLVEGLGRRPEDGSVDQAISRLAARTPLGVVAQPVQLARLVAALLDDDVTGFVTGAVFAADGGALLKLGTE